MSNWGAGYVTEIGYTYGYYPELLPSRLAFVCLTKGIEAPGLGVEPIRLLELGCGQGLCANIIAAANPHIDYTAVDFNPAHISGAASLAREAGTTNVHFREASFADIAADDKIGQFDVITLHGIYTWLSVENRDYILRIAREKLKAGGILYVSYNCYPGWSNIVPVRRLFADTKTYMPKAPIMDRVARGFELFERLQSVKARYFTENPGLTKW